MMKDSEGLKESTFLKIFKNLWADNGEIINYHYTSYGDI